MADNAKLTRAADNIRVLAASMVEKAKSGHPGGAMGGADFINVLYTEFLRYDPDDLRYPFRDRLFLDPGHMSPMLYSTLALAGNYTMDDLKAFRQWGSCTPGHPEVDVLRGVENTSGPLGQGHAMALGAAIAERFMVARFGQWQAHKTYAYISDGAVQEEISQGQIQGLGLERAPRRRTVGRRDPRRAPHGRCRDRASDDHHRPHGDGQRRGSRRRHVV